MADNQTEGLMKVPHFKQGGIVDIKVGSAYLSKLNETLQFLIEGKGEELAALRDKAANNYEGINPWENSVVTIGTLIQEIMKAAEATGQIEYKEMEGMDEASLRSNQEEDSDPEQ